MREGAQAREEQAASSPHHVIEGLACCSHPRVTVTRFHFNKAHPPCVHCPLPLASHPYRPPLTEDGTLLISSQMGSISINLGTVRHALGCGLHAAKGMS